MQKNIVPAPFPMPEVSVIAVFFNESACAATVVQELVDVFSTTEFDVEILLVENGSTDGTGRCLKPFVNQQVRMVTVPVNRGFGHGLLSGAKQSRGKWLCLMGGDGQTNPMDAVNLIRQAKRAGEPCLCTGVRCRRDDRLVRLAISFVFHHAFCLFSGVRVRDVNGLPKVLLAETLRQCNPMAERWLLDAELILAANQKGLPILQQEVVYRRRQGGRSHVRLDTVWEFICFLTDVRRRKTISGGKK